MLTLAVDTSAVPLAVALVDDDAVLAEWTEAAQMRHAEALVPAIARLFVEGGRDQRELGRIVVARGPGSYTGIRLGVTAAKAIAYALRIPLHGISSLAALALAVPPGTPGWIVPLVDARRGRAYAAVYRWRGAALETVEAEHVAEIVSLAARLAERVEGADAPVFVVGYPAVPEGEALRAALGSRAVIVPSSFALPRAARLVWLVDQGFGEAVNAESDDLEALAAFAPAYLQKSEPERRLEDRVYEPGNDRARRAAVRSDAADGGRRRP
ncbi:MAG: tRNA (adenosine(37)-N6)-threonylcarbamoyltransferase complex dimerization subunit type 1 TsaB [Hydrogenibacillus sp.]|nr:tRNA (adenosine(37)-N6)-threonylcarbamoyltransferase complex dimerization subunit type 1 TsaB [Hydrogenibacillus sp.]